MASLTEVYDGHVGGEASLRQLTLGIALFVAGSIMLVVGIVVASTEVLSAVGVGRFESRRIAGLLAGLGVPSVFLGIFTVLPASRRVRAAAAIGASVAVLGVAMFWSIYPQGWLGATENHRTFEVVAIYFVGTIVTFWCLFVAVANFKTRNDPGGTVKLEITKEGKTRIVEVDRGDLRRNGLGGIGLLGSTPDGSVGTQTNRPSAAASDGGSAEPEIRTPVGSSSGGIVETSTPDRGVDVLDGSSGSERNPVDAYCGNCVHFDYVRTSTGMQPYCGHHAETMDDMTACPEWSANNQ